MDYLRQPRGKGHDSRISLRPRRACARVSPSTPSPPNITHHHTHATQDTRTFARLAWPAYPRPPSTRPPPPKNDPSRCHPDGRVGQGMRYRWRRKARLERQGPRRKPLVLACLSPSASASASVHQCIRDPPRLGQPTVGLRRPARKPNATLASLDSGSVFMLPYRTRRGKKARHHRDPPVHPSVTSLSG